MPPGDDWDQSFGLNCASYCECDLYYILVALSRQPQNLNDGVRRRGGWSVEIPRWIVRESIVIDSSILPSFSFASEWSSAKVSKSLMICFTSDRSYVAPPRSIRNRPLFIIHLLDAVFDRWIGKPDAGFWVAWRALMAWRGLGCIVRVA